MSTVEQVVELAAELTAAQAAASKAISERQQKWRDDPAGRRSRGARQTATNRRRERAMTALIEAVQSPDAPAVVREHFQTNGPTYYEAAACAPLLLRKEAA